MSEVQPIPEGYHTVTPSLTVNDAAAAIDFYKRAFGAAELSRAMAPDGRRVFHADVRIGNSIVMLNDEFPEMGGKPGPKGLGGSPVALYVYVEDADALFKQAVEAGAEVAMPINDMFWGDRQGAVTDPFGFTWSIATRKENVSEDERRRRVEAMSQGT